MNELLNCNVGCIFLTMGLPTLDPVMTSVLDYIHQHALFLGSWGGFAKSLGLILAMCVTSYECWMMMLGRRGIDVMKLFRIVGISLCIVSLITTHSTGNAGQKPSCQKIPIGGRKWHTP